MMIETLELQTIRRIGELIKGIGSQFTDYADKKEKQIAEDVRQQHAKKEHEARLHALTAPSQS